MYVIMHKEVNIPHIDGYYSLLVGAAGQQGKINTDVNDNVGDSISKKNKNYCELTGYYWLWKNNSDDIVGINHYRRFFSKALLSKRENQYLTVDDIRLLLSKYDLIVPFRKHYRKKYERSVNIAPNKEDLERMRAAIETIAPDYLDDYIWFLNQNTTYLYNMVVMRKTMFDRYCEWLFPVLEYIETNHDVGTEDNYRSRLFGFLSERLLMVWTHHNIPSSRIYEMRVVNTDQTLFAEVKGRVHDVIRNITYNLNITGADK